MSNRVPAVDKKVRRFTRQFKYSILALLLMGVCALNAPAQDDLRHEVSSQHEELTPDQKSNASALIQIVRESTARFKDVSVAEAEGYALQFGCVSGPDQGAMGLHFVNGALVNSGVIEARRPRIVIYEPTPHRGLRLIGADYLVIASSWDAAHSGPPELMGQLLYLFDTPNRFGLPAFYTLHVWAWKDNPNGAFVNWHPKVSCEAFAGSATTSR